MRNQPLQTIQKLVQERYPQTKAVFWAGSVSKNQGTSASDLDLIVVYEKLPNAYREAFIYEEWPIDVFVNDIDTLCHFFEESKTSSGISGLMYMILDGQEVTIPSSFSETIKSLAQQAFNDGPTAWDQARIDKERFFITDILEDIKFPASRNEQIASTARLYEILAQFYFRSHRKWSASGKSIPRYLKQYNPDLAEEYTQSFAKLFQIGDTVDLEKLVKKIITPFGGLLWDGFILDAVGK